MSKAMAVREKRVRKKGVKRIGKRNRIKKKKTEMQKQKRSEFYFFFFRCS